MIKAIENHNRAAGTGPGITNADRRHETIRGSHAQAPPAPPLFFPGGWGGGGGVFFFWQERWPLQPFGGSRAVFIADQLRPVALFSGWNLLGPAGYLAQSNRAWVCVAWPPALAVYAKLRR